MTSSGWAQRPSKRGGWGGRSKGQTAAWKRARRAHLLADPWCVDCAAAGEQTRAGEVDHVVGRENDPAHQHLESVCAPHHAARTMRQSLAARAGGCSAGDCRCPEPRTVTVWTR